MDPLDTTNTSSGSCATCTDKLYHLYRIDESTGEEVYDEELDDYTWEAEYYYDLESTFATKELAVKFILDTSLEDEEPDKWVISEGPYKDVR